MNDPYRGSTMPPALRRPTFAAAAMILVVLFAVVSAGCSSSREIDVRSEPGQSTTTEEPIDDAGYDSGAEGIEKLQALLKKLLADDDVCSVLQQRNAPSNQLDPSLFLSPTARQVLTQGLVEVMDHLIAISDPSLHGPFKVQKDAFVQVLDVVDRFANNPNDPRSTAAIQTLVQAPDFVAAQGQISAWVSSNCH